MAPWPTHNPISIGQLPHRAVSRDTLQLHCAHDGGGAAELVERQQPQRVPHENRQPGTGQAGIAAAAQRDRESGQPKIGLGLAAAGGEEQQVHAFAVGMVRIGEAGQA